MVELLHCWDEEETLFVEAVVVLYGETLLFLVGEGGDG